MRSTELATNVDSGRQTAQPVLAQLFRDHFDSVFAFCLVRCGSRPLAEEIASDVFADAVRTVVGDDEVVLNRSWLFSVARRRLIDHWRRAERQRRRIERLTRLSLPTANELVGHPTLEDEHLLSALASLPERQRTVLVLRYLDEMSVGEVADALQVSYQATESLLARARRSFARSYKDGVT